MKLVFAPHAEERRFAASQKFKRERADAFEDGLMARKLGLVTDDNPHAKHTDLFFCWTSGFNYSGE